MGLGEEDEPGAKDLRTEMERMKEQIASLNMGTQGMTSELQKEMDQMRQQISQLSSEMKPVKENLESQFGDKTAYSSDDQDDQLDKKYR
mmetsp:Transcript_8236/g.13789  ORF Transcript_8236/g.13789 Transcript_8236/m.13789 type:complete len:89 (+) Transcript_8236:2060-2326(+)